MALPSYTLSIPGHLGRQYRWPLPHRLESHRVMPYPPVNTKDTLVRSSMWAAAGLCSRSTASTCDHRAF